jgi:hypothetical protein
MLRDPSRACSLHDPRAMQLARETLDRVTGGGAPTPKLIWPGMRTPPQTPGVPRVGFESCITCGPARWAAEWAAARR